MSWHKPENKQEQLLNSLLQPVSAVYKLGALSRLIAYERRVLRQKKLNVPVISIGNLTVGGTGKTPIIIDLARDLSQAGLKVGILSRGYKRQSTQATTVVSDGRNILVDVDQAGDEPYLIARSVPAAVVVVGADRYEAGKIAAEDYACDVLLLDDGFQHLKLARNFDFLIWDYNDDPQQAKLLPAGRLREPMASISRADCLVISKLPDTPDPERMSAIRVMANRFKPGIPIIQCRFEASALHRVYNKEKVRVTTRSAGIRVFAFCGIARPEGFIRNLESMGCVVAGKQTFSDHHWFNANDTNKLVEEFKKSEAQYLVTTEKDRVRLPEDFIEQVPLLELSLTTEWLGHAPVDLPGVKMLTRKRTAVGKATGAPV
ncbi:MAG: tetraacyldisaccharide 4'-kinase [Candidatus Obscuribacterales bacterium]|nr:tetraacyldisaccharide 4'-kinase [Candidatus Obscuribacterales bacterium]